MLEFVLVFSGIMMGLTAGIVVYLKHQLLLLESYKKEISVKREEQEKALSELSELHKATVEKYQKVSNDLASLKGDISGIKLHGPQYGVKR